MSVASEGSVSHFFSYSHYFYFHLLVIQIFPLFIHAGEIQRQKEFEVAMFMYRTGEQQNIHNNRQNDISSQKSKGNVSILSSFPSLFVLIIFYSLIVSSV